MERWEVLQQIQNRVAHAVEDLGSILTVSAGPLTIGEAGMIASEVSKCVVKVHNGINRAIASIERSHDPFTE